MWHMKSSIFELRALLKLEKSLKKFYNYYNHYKICGIME